MNRLQDKVVLVTGGASGIGRAICRRIAEEGAIVMVTDLDQDAGQKVAAEIISSGHNACFMLLDVAEETNWVAAVKQVLSQYGRLDALVNNAGALLMTKMLESTTAEWDGVFDANARSVYLGCRHMVPVMISSGGGAIVNVCSAAGLTSSMGGSIFEASKGAVRFFTRSLAGELAPHNIRANVLHPGLVETEENELTSDPREVEKLLGSAYLRRAAQPREIANAALFLLSDEASYVTGSEFAIDGGYTAANL